MVKPFYINTKGAWVPGHNQSCGAGSQLHAGARAELIPTPVTKALSSFGGRIAAQTMQFMFRGDAQAMLNYVAIRPYAMMGAIRVALGDSPEGKVVLNPAGGYSPVCYWLAKEFPDTQFIEMDVSKTINFKKTALEPFIIPDNLDLRSIDLKEKNLHDVLQEKVDVILLSGAYVSRNNYRDALRYLTNVVKEDSYVIATFPDRSGIENFVENCTVFTRIVGNPKGAIENSSELTGLFRGTDFGIEKVITLSGYAKKHDKPNPADIEVIAIARYGLEEPAQHEEEDLNILSEIEDSVSGSGSNGVSPFIDFDLDSFKSFPRRYRRRPPESKI